ncbi:MAG: glycerophosphodiester phosphodiesterase [Prevotellaceae bacterium]|jgi:glycerophosphoryl diester phosphodiesterase|nr:glycerophosphodiester phosphodiesterase [Prevotellaceae bacterium]
MKKIILTISAIVLFSPILQAQFATNKVVAHRGAWKADSLPQNSVASFVRAIELGCAGSEFDVYLTADSVLVLNHDADLQGLSVEKSTLAELQQKKLSNGETIALLDDIMKNLVKQTTTLAFLEIKPSSINQQHGFAAVDKILEMAKRYNADNWIVYISFDYSYLRRINEKNPNARTAFLGAEKTIDEIIADKQFGIDFNHKQFKNDENIITIAKKNGINVNVWTVNKVEDMQYFLNKNVDYITTDEPELQLRIKN